MALIRLRLQNAFKISDSKTSEYTNKKSFGENSLKVNLIV